MYIIQKNTNKAWGALVFTNWNQKYLRRSTNKWILQNCVYIFIISPVWLRTVSLRCVSPAVEVCRPSCQQNVIWMPVQTQDSGIHRLLDVLTQPPAKTETNQMNHVTWGIVPANRNHPRVCIVHIHKGKLPVILFLKVADRYEAIPAAQSELVLQRRPLDTGGCAVDSHQDQGGLPHTVLQCPHVGVPVRGTSHKAVGLRGPVYAYWHIIIFRTCTFIL